MDNRLDGRVLLAVVLAAVTLFVWYSFFTPTPPPREPLSETPATDVAPSQGASASPEATPEAPLPPEETFVIKGNGFTAEISSHGGRIKSWKIHDPQYATKDGTLLDLVPSAPEELKQPWPGEVIFEKASFPVPRQMAFTRVAEDEEAKALHLRWTNPEGTISLDKYYQVDGPGLSLKIELTNQGQKSETAKLALSIDGYQDPTKTEGEGFWIFRSPPDVARPSCYINDELYTLEVGKNAQETYTGDLSWAGINRTYFLSAFYPKGATPEALSCALSMGASGAEQVVITYPENTISQGQTLTHSLGIYFGPKQLDTLSALNVNLDESVDYGWFGLIAKGMLYLLKFFYGLVGNWGIAIILLTLVVRLIMFYPSQKSYKSMQGMAALKPELDALKEKYKDDQQRFVQEQMALFKAHGVSPFGGCLPLLLQMPFFFALYRMLYQSVEIYQADFGLWIHDLSAPDPYYILPLLLGAIMILQQKLTPTTMDAAQARLMLWLMPIMMTLFMLFLPAGLVIYTLVSVLFGFVQQYIIRRNSPPPVAAAAASAPAPSSPSKPSPRRKKR